MRKELLIGCGSQRLKYLRVNGTDWEGLVTLDFDASHKPDVVHNLTDIPLPFEADTFDEIHAYHVMEHVGQQGDWRFFFDQWADFWRILKPGGMFFVVSPDASSKWAWGDPGHTRVMSEHSLMFLHQPNYSQVGKTAMTDYRFCYEADFDVVYREVVQDEFRFALKAVKPSRFGRQVDASLDAKAA